MIGWAAIMKLHRKEGLEDGYDLPLRPKWSLEDVNDEGKDEWRD